MAKLPEPQTPFGLYLRKTGLTDEGLKTRRTEEFAIVSLGETPVTDTGLKELAGLKNLQDLDLFGTKVTDTGLKELVGLKSLQSLYLCSTKVTDAGMKELAGLQSLKTWTFPRR